MNLFGLWFETPWAFLGLLILPWMVHRALGHSRNGRVPIPNRDAFEAAHGGFIAYLWWLPDMLRIATVAVLIIAAARPQTEDRQVVTGEGVDIMLALDMSISMNAVDLSEEELLATLAEEERPRNRFEIARDTLQEFTTSRSQDRIGLVVFGREAWLKYPLTLDYGRLVTTLDELNSMASIRTARLVSASMGARSAGLERLSATRWPRITVRCPRPLAASSCSSRTESRRAVSGWGCHRPTYRQPAPEEAVRVYTFLVGSRSRRGSQTSTAGAVPLSMLRVCRLTESHHAYPTDPALLKRSRR